MERWAGGSSGSLAACVVDVQVACGYRLIGPGPGSLLLAPKTSLHYELHLWPPARCRLGQEPAMVHTLCNFPKVVFLMVTDMGLADLGLSHAGRPVVTGFFI